MARGALSLERPRQAARQNRCTDAISCFTDRSVGQPNNGEPRQAIGDMDFDRDRAANGTTQRC
jgi:hypothetical protein